MRDWPGARTAELEVGPGMYYCACTIRTKWRLIHPEMLVELSVSLFDSLAEFICSKGSSSAQAPSLFVAKDQAPSVMVYKPSSTVKPIRQTKA